MIESVRLWFAALTQREKWLVATAGTLAGLSIAVFAIIMPALSVVEKAALDLDEAVQADPNNVAAWSARGQAYERLGDKAKAAASYNRALALRPGDGNARSGLVRTGG